VSVLQITGISGYFFSFVTPTRKQWFYQCFDTHWFNCSVNYINSTVNNPTLLLLIWLI